MRIARYTSILSALAAAALCHDSSTAQPVELTAVGQYYRLELPFTASRFYDEVLVERVAPHGLASPAPLAPIPLPIQLRGLTGQLLELPDRGRLYFVALDIGGAVRLFALDLFLREARSITPPIELGAPYAVQALAAPDGSKLYVQWFAPAALRETDIYDAETLQWLNRTAEFLPDERAIGFEHQYPYMWTLDRTGSPVLVNTIADHVELVFDPSRLLGDAEGGVTDAWRDLVLLRLQADRDRFLVVDVRSGEIGPPLDLEEARRAEPRLALAGRLLVLADRENALLRRGRRTTAIATGRGTIFDLRSLDPLRDFALVAPPDLPMDALGTHADRSRPGRLWLYTPTDEARYDFDLPSCDRVPSDGDAISAEVEGLWQSSDPRRYRYRVHVSRSSLGAVSAVAVAAGRETAEVYAPIGWGVDHIKSERWVRWTNGLGPAQEDVAPGETAGGFEIAAKSGTRPAIVEYRAQAALGLPRGCENGDRFLNNSLNGHTVAPERIGTDDPRKLSQRLERLVERSCEIGWLDPSDCSTLSGLAAELVRSENRVVVIERFQRRLNELNLRSEALTPLLHDAAAAVSEAVD